MDNIEILENFFTLLIGLSVATERLVEIVKGIINFLSQSLEEPQEDKKLERRRKLKLQVIAIFAGLLTAMLTRLTFETDLPAPMKTISGTIICGLLASGGSGFWNSLLSYILKVKENINLNSKDLRLNIAYREKKLNEIRAGLSKKK